MANEDDEFNFIISDKKKPDLNGASLVGADLRGADLSEEDLHEASMWNANLVGADLSCADLRRADLTGADLAGADLSGADLSDACLIEAKLHKARMMGSDLSRADLSNADLSEAEMRGAILRRADLIGANLHLARLFLTKLHQANLISAVLSDAFLRNADLSDTYLWEANLNGADLKGADLSGADLYKTNLSGADLYKVDLSGANLSEANLIGANLRETNLSSAQFVETKIERAKLTGSRIYGISAWRLEGIPEDQSNLIITRYDEPTITVDNLEVAQFIYLLLHSQKIRDAIDTIAKKAVLILGRFTSERMVVLNAIRDELRKQGYLPILFDWEKPANRDLLETVSTLAHLSRFVIADITDAKSIPAELERIVPALPSVAVQPLMLISDYEYALFDHIKRYPWVLDVYLYDNQDMLLANLKEHVIDPAEAKSRELIPPAAI